MTPWVAIPLLAGIGLLYAGLWAVYDHALQSKRPLFAALVDAVVTSFSFIAWAIMVRTGRETSIDGIIAYSVGAAFGTYFIVRIRQKQAVEAEAKALEKDA